ncbi:MAG: formylglycine-generating enzyme family protein [Chitinivibrionia bacterium]|nr:formylglycine-generating enzyme family protein [Chitinivibrionia bacterium]
MFINAQNNGNENSGDNVATIKGIEFVLVKAGTFTMGSPTGEQGRYGNENQHRVRITYDYWISKYPITQLQYREVNGNSPSYYNGDKNPVECVTWYDANDFAEVIGGRLPTETEWEFAARGGSKNSAYIYSGSNNLNDVGWHFKNIPNGGTQAVGQKQPNALGIHDMSGNVWEWCSDWYDFYPTDALTTNPTGPSIGYYRVMRGGSWYNIADNCRVAYRANGYPSGSGFNVGFRVVVPMSQTT